MNITFYGAAREVTGSSHLLHAGDDRILLDCGMFQGRRRESFEKNRHLPFDPRQVTSLVLSHAHIDHSGRIPVLLKQPFNGRVVCTRPTAAACRYLLLDSAHIQESDAAYLNYKTLRGHLLQASRQHGRTAGSRRREIARRLKKGPHQLDLAVIEALLRENRLETVEPLYTIQDAEHAIGYLDGYPYRYPVVIGRHTRVTLYDAGHILGSAISMIRITHDGKVRNVCYTGDIGRFGKPIIKDPTMAFEEEDRNVDLLVMESTYGDRAHEAVQDLKPELARVLRETVERGGSLLIPSFAYGRTQELIYFLHELYDEGAVPKVPIYIDSPLATKITRVFGEHPEVYDRDTHETFLMNGQNPFQMEKMHFIDSVEASMALNREEKPHVVIAASGMCEAGRILHHLRYKIHNSKHTILVVGYMAAHTLGRRILEQGTAYEAAGRRGAAPMVKILNKEYPLKARVIKLGGFSAHADRNELLRFVRASNLRIKQIALVHGEEAQSLSLAADLKREGYSVTVPVSGETLEIP